MNWSKTISNVFHPVLAPLLLVFGYFNLLPKHIDGDIVDRVVLLVVLAGVLVPVAMLYVLKKVKIISDFNLNTIEERKFPFLFFILLFYLISNTIQKTPAVDELHYAFLGFSLSLVISYILFFFKIKVSIHTMVMSGVLSFLIVLSHLYKINLINYICLIILLIGLLAYSRLKEKAHNLKEVLIGFLIGFICPAIIYFSDTFIVNT
ncbi:MAG: phosphatase PAP2 family protein [Flavobacteriaceae bacterium]|nr:phosphatase PAP2 family protein [Flavobacteriaceae bacterium]